MPEDAPSGGQMHHSQLSRAQREALARSQISRAQREALARKNQMEQNSPADSRDTPLREARRQAAEQRREAGVVIDVSEDKQSELAYEPVVGPPNLSERLYQHREVLLYKLDAVETAIRLLEQNPDLTVIINALDQANMATQE